MPSNGLSSRRSTLKRPLVCKSPDPALCGKCQFFSTFDAYNTPPGGILSTHWNFICDSDPKDSTFNIIVAFPFVLSPPPSVLTINELAAIFVVAPLLIGEYALDITLINSTRCKYRNTIPVSVT